MAQYSDPSQLNGFFKTIYADKLKDLVPSNVKLSKLISLVPMNKRNGLDYRQAVNN